MKLFREIVKKIGADTDTGLSLLYTVASDRGGYFQNVKGIAFFSQGEIRLSLKKGEVKIVGDGLIIEKYSEGDVFIRGTIVSVEQLI